VGTSGSGKTTLLKLLLKFYNPSEGEILLGGTNLKDVSHYNWREMCGVVMQDGYIFSDTIANNIAIGQERVDRTRLAEVMHIAQLDGVLATLPLRYNTRIGRDGVGLSKGQLQRVLLARALYKNPEYLFLDEATSALDAETESLVVEQLRQTLKGKTVVVIAHRLSTVRHADQIVVLEKGMITECGSHAALVERRGRYYELIRNQLELGE
jgi:ATP-binding cassette subfamily B protein